LLVDPEAEDGDSILASLMPDIFDLGMRGREDEATQKNISLPIALLIHSVKNMGGKVTYLWGVGHLSPSTSPSQVSPIAEHISQKREKRKGQSVILCLSSPIRWNPRKGRDLRMDLRVLRREMGESRNHLRNELGLD